MPTVVTMDVTLLYFDGCPSWTLADERLAEIAAERPDLVVRRQQVTTPEDAARLGFRGSPSIHVDGVDVFADTGGGTGLACRLYPTPAGLAGAPSVDQLRAALTNA